MSVYGRIQRSLNWKSAIAELLIIVIGIMMALAVDRWAEERRDATIARSYVARLKNDVDVDLAGYEKTVDWAQAIDSSALYVLEVYRGRNPLPAEYDLFVFHIYRASWAVMGRSTSTTYDDLISTGNLGLLDVSVRSAITDYYGLKASYIEDRSRSLDEISRQGYWRIPEVVLGPDLAPSVWLAIQGNGPDFLPEFGLLELSDSDVDKVVNALRAVGNLETLLAQIRHNMAQRRILFGERLPDAAKRFRDVLEFHDPSDSP